MTAHVPPAGIEIESLAALDDALATGLPPARMRLQDLDLREYRGLDDRSDLDQMVVLGGHLSPALDAHLRAQGAIIFPDDPDAAPIRPYRARLYTADELYAGLEAGYDATPDARAYVWYRQGREQPDVFSALLQAIHDDSIADALAEFVEGHRVIGVMGGHAVARGTSAYAEAARLGFELAGRGFVVATGGGPGAMEAANLGAAARDSRDLTEALTIIAKVPGFADVRAWALAGLRAREVIETRPLGEERGRSLGIPTWFYGHEPPNVFGEGIAKFFSNALREDALLALAGAGVFVLPGAAGTVQEIFQVATRAYYSTEAPPPLILVDERHWTQTIPVWPALQALAAGRPMARRIALVNDLDQALSLVE